LRVAAVSAAGVGAFTTVRPPIAVTGSVSNVGVGGASIAASANANGGGTGTVSFEVATAATPGTVVATVAATPSTVTGSSPTGASAALTGLQPATAYLVRNVVSNGALVARGSTTPFTTTATIVSSNLSPVYTGLPVVISTVTSPVGLPLTRTFVGTGGTTYPSTSTPPANVGTYTVTTAATDPAVGGTEVATLTIGPKPLAVTVAAADRPYNATTLAQLTLGLVGLVDGDDVQLHAGSVSGAFDDPVAGIAKTVHVTAAPGYLTGLDLANYAASIAGTTTATIEPAAQTLTFSSTAPASATLGATYLPSVVSSAGLTPVLSIDPDAGAICALSNGTVTMLTAGSCIVVANQEGNSNFAAAAEVRQTFTVSSLPSSPTGVWTSIDDNAAALTWTAGAAGSSPISEYIVQYSTDGDGWTTVSSGSAATSAAFELPSASAPYALRVAAISAVGTGPFTVVRPPLATTGAVTAVGPFVANVAGSVDANANGSAAQVSFEVATSEAGLGTEAATMFEAAPAIVIGSGADAVEAALTGLTPGTQYFVRTIVVADGFSIRGAVNSFTTHASIVSSGLSPVYSGVPAVLSTVTAPAELALTRTFVGIDGTVYPSSSDAPTDAGTYRVTTIVADHSLDGVEIVTLTIQKASQTLSFTSTAPTAAVVRGSYAPSVASSAGLTPSLSIDAAASATCSVSSGVVTFVAAGSCIVIAHQSGTNNFTAAAPVQQSFTIAPEVAPAVPIDVTVSITDRDTSISWTAGDAGTSPITSYLVQYSTDDTTWELMSSGSAATEATFDLPSASAPYALRVAGVSDAGVGTFATIRPPLAATSAVTDIGVSGATAEGAVNANDGATVELTFELAARAIDLGTSSATNVPASPGTASGPGDVGPSGALTALLPNTEYFVRVVASTEGIVVRGATRAFTTDASIVSSNLSPVYTGSPVVMSTTTTPADLGLERSFVGIDGTVYPSSPTPPTAAGTYRVSTNPADHSIGGGEVVTLTIVPKPVTVTVAAVERPYDGTTVVELNLGLVGAVDGDDVSVDPTSVSAELDDPDAGVDKIARLTVESDLLAGLDAGNYSPSIADDVTVTIAPGVAPAAPTDIVVSITDSDAAMSWSPGAAGTSPITSYLVQYSSDGTTWDTMSSGSNSTSASFELPSSSTPYALRVAGVSLAGTGTFATVRPPVVVTGTIAAVDPFGASIVGSANANAPDGHGDVVFEIATAAAELGTRAGDAVDANPASISGTAETAVTAELADLQPVTSYVVRAVVTADGFIVRGTVLTFTTPASITSSGLSQTYTGSPVMIGAVTAPAGLELVRTFVGIDGTVYPSSSTPPTDAGSYRVTTIPADSAIEGLEVVTLTILKATHTLAFVSTAPTAATVGDTYEPQAVSTAGLVPSISVAPVSTSICSLANGIATSLASGSCVLVATHAGSRNYTAAVAVEQAFTIAAVLVPPPAPTPIPDPAPDTTPAPAIPTDLSLSVKLTPGDGVSNAPVEVRGDGLKPNSGVRIELQPTDVLLGTATTDAAGSFSTTVLLPAVVPSGTHRVVATGIAPDGTPVSRTEEVFVDWSGSFVEVQSIGGYTPLPATRILDTRVSGQRLAAGTEYQLVVPGDIVPADASAIAFNLTVTNADHNGYITAYPCGAARPLAAAINFSAGETKASLVESLSRRDGMLCLWSNVGTDVVVDIQGFHSESSVGRLVPRTAVRLIDTRLTTRMVAEQVLRIPVIGDGRAAAGTTAVALNVAVDAPDDPGFLTVYPCGTPRPWTSNLNFEAGQTLSNEVLVRPGDGGEVCVYTTDATQVVVDLNATYNAQGTSRFTGMVPGRLGDTRLTTRLAAGEVVEWTVVGDNGAPAGTTALSLNIAVTDPAAAGFLTVYPCGATRPWASNLNFAAGQTISNHVTATVGNDGTVCVYTTRATDVVIDVEGTYQAES